ncbi:hypothetical protein CBR_g19612 [Chara braunii]|uniref:Uncharacterized protein n=1 Tax=Chara braunii TaxID=69332 RepID=A0A388KYG9_CHABU|nr:hypothetical protein CBR_g19612 [Chara braunii]|eukprot:GBG75099.1 hypothetical protein CBR_g19612 [Chara braunii]
MFRWSEQSDVANEDEIPNDEVELLVIQAWRTDMEGELVGILFGLVGIDHLVSITDELLVFLAQLLDDLPLGIIAQCHQCPAHNTLERALTPQLLWTPCSETYGENRYYPSISKYLESVEVIHPHLWEQVGALDVATTENEAEDSTEIESSGSAYSEHSESESGEQNGSARNGASQKTWRLHNGGKKERRGSDL